MNQFLKPEILSSQNKWFFPSWNLLFESTRETCIINSAPILIIQLCRFSNQGDQLVKKENLFSCMQNESNKDHTVPITIEHEVCFTNKYSLIATINHSSTLNMGHYWAFIKTYTLPLGTLAMTSWFLMLNKILLQYYMIHPFLQESLNFSRICQTLSWFCRGFVMSDIVFGCDDPTYNPSPVWEWSLLTQFSGITTLQSLLTFREAVQEGLI